MRLRRSLALAVALVVALGSLAGCGSETVHQLPPAAEPPHSPMAARVAAGTVTAIGNSPEGVVVDAATGVVAVALRDPARLALVDAASAAVRRRVDLPGAAQPSGVATLDGGRRVAVVSVRERRLELYDTRTLRRIGSAPAGVGPTHVACLDRGWCYVADTRGDALLVFSVGDGVEPTRRYRLPGGPYGIALDRARGRLFVTLPARNELVELMAHGRPHVVRRWPTVRQPDSVAVDERTGDVLVTGRVDGVLERVTP